MMPPCILVAGIGNVFLGDDGFGVATVQRLAARPQPEGVRIEDFGIRGLDLVYALLEPFDAIIFVDTASRRREPGALYLIEPDVDETAPATLDAHGMDPVKVLALARALGAPATRTFLVGCEPGFMPPADSEDVVMELTAPVLAAVDGAVTLVESLVAQIRAAQSTTEALNLT